MANSFEKLSFTKDWNNPSDFPTYEESETRVRADMQLLHDEVKDFINDKLIPGIESMAVPGTGDMRVDVYDPDGFMQDSFAYAREQASAAITEYDTTQTIKFDGVELRIKDVENALNSVPGVIGLHRVYSEAGTYKAKLPDNVAAVYVLAVGAGGGGGGGHNYNDGDIQSAKYYGGGGGAGGSAAFLGPILPENISDFSIVVGAGGAGGISNRPGESGGASSVFGLTANGGAGGGSNGYAYTAGEKGALTTNAMGGASGGTGAICEYDAATAGLAARSGTAGNTSEGIIPLLMAHFSAGGGGGGCRDAVAGSAGGSCAFGDGGNGGNYNTVGADGGSCCGGGGGGSGNSGVGYAGGKGGDGYVAIWYQIRYSNDKQVTTDD